MQKEIDTVLSVLKTTPQRWIQMSETIPSELFLRAPAPKEWSAHDCLQHMVDTESMVFPARVGYLLRGEDFPAFNPDEGGTKSNKGLSSIDLAKEFGRLREESIKILMRVKPDDLEKKARHQELGLVSLGEMINEWAGHDLMHTIQGEKAMIQIFISGCGPWKPAFLDHIIDAK
jgi:hypothetical protein